MEFTKDMARQIAERMATKIALEYDNKDQFKENQRMNPFHSERVGMEQMLKMMGVEFEYVFNDDVTEIVAVVVMGELADVLHFNW